MARREKKPVHKVVMTEGKRNIIQQLLQEYDIETAEDIQDALKDLLGGTIKEMMEAEMDDHLGYQKSERSDSDDYRNGYKSKRVNSSYGSMDIDVPQDRKSTFEPQIVKKRQKDISDIDQKIMEKDLRRITDYSFETGLAGLACYVSLRLIGKNEETVFDKSFIDELMYACSRMEISDHNSTVGVAMLLGLYNGKRVDYPYIDIIKRIVNKQVDGKQEELSWRNGLKLLLL